MTAAVWIDDAAGLAEWCARWRSAPVLAVDTEFMRTDTYYPKAGLLQICDGSDSVLIDPLAIDDWQPLVAVLTDPAVLKVVHAASEDLEVFSVLCETVPTPLFDTQIAATLTGIGDAPGFARLVAALLDVDLPKQETRSDWLCRPLRPQQIDYAVGDVAWLYKAYRALVEHLDGERRDWVLADSAALGERIASEVAPEQFYLRLRAAHSLDGSTLAVFRRLCEWRERRARSENRPRGWIVNDAQLLAISRVRPIDRESLAAIAELPPTLQRRRGDDLLDCVRRGLDDDPTLVPRPPSAHIGPADRPLLKALRAQLAATAQQLGVPAQALARKRDLVELVADDATAPALLSGWRAAVIGNDLSATVQRHRSPSCN